MGIAKTISGKLSLSMGLAISALVLGHSAIIGWHETELARQSVMELASERADNITRKVAVQITEATSAGTALTSSIGAYIETGEAARDKIIDMIEAIPPKYPNLYGAWMTGIVNGATNDLLTGEGGVNDAGVFTPYWTKSADGTLAFSTFDIDPDAQWYKLPLSAKEGFITEPYLSSEGRLLTSVTVPMLIDGRVVGIAGVDIGLNDLTRMISEFVAFEGGQTLLVDAGGKWLANPDQEALTKPYQDPGAELLMAALEDGKSRVIPGMPDGGTRLIYPFTAPGMNTTWAAILDVPGEIFAAPVRVAIQKTAVGGLLILVMALVTIQFASVVIVRRPLGRMLSAVNTLAAGTYDTQVPDLDRRDEIGQMARSVEVLRKALVERAELERSQAAQEAELSREREAALEQKLAMEAQQADEAERRRLEEERQRTERDQLRAQTDAEKERVREEQKRVVNALTLSLSAMSEGNLSIHIDEVFPPEYEQLRQDFNAAVDKIAGLVGAIIESARSIRNESDSLDQAATQMSIRTESQAASLEETAAAITELTASVENSSSSAKDAARNVSQAREKTDAGGNVVQRTIAAMTEIAESSKKISQITDVIDDIAFQTNLLALNAGVEAARAGEAGRGFSVVAQEVRALAQRSSESAREISDLISTSTRQVDAGVALASDSGHALEEIGEMILALNGLVETIAVTSVQQSTSLSEISTAVNRLDEVTQQNAAMFEETTAAVSSLKSQTEILEANTGTFSLSGDHAGRQPAKPSSPEHANLKLVSRAADMRMAATSGHQFR